MRIKGNSACQGIFNCEEFQFTVSNVLHGYAKQMICATDKQNEVDSTQSRKRLLYS